MAEGVWLDESGIATFEFAVTVLLLMAVLLGVLAAMDAVYMRTVTQHVATAIGRQAIYRREGHWAELIQGGHRMMADNLGVQQVTEACRQLCEKECGGSCEEATCIEITETHHALLSLVNSEVTVSVTHYVSVPVISSTHLFTNTLQCFKVGAQYKVNLWSAGIIFNVPQR